MTKMIRSAKTKAEFIKFLEEHPEQRFWQAVRNFSGYPFVLVSTEPPFNFPGDWKGQELPKDSFYWEENDD